MTRVAVIRRAALLAVVSTLIVPASARAQALTMQMSNGWTFSFSGNVNAFLVYQLSNISDSGRTINGGLTPVEGTNPRIRTGLLPAFATFDAKGKEGGIMLDVHFGFAPEIQNGGGALGNIHDNFGNGTQAGAQIDMRQVYLTASGTWGQILAGREIGLFDRQNILQDMTLFGVGASGGNVGAGGTTLGRIGYGYVYPNFVPQITYSTPSTNSVVWYIGIFDPSAVGGTGVSTSPFIYNRAPRLESELTWTDNLSATPPPAGATSDQLFLWIGGLWQEAYTAPSGGTSVTSAGGDAGAKLTISDISLVAAGYYGKGIGSTLLLTTALATDADSNARTSYGGYVQAVLKLSPWWSIGASFGGAWLNETTADKADVVNGPLLLKYNILGSAILTYQWTKSLRWVGEYDWTQSKNQGSTLIPAESITASQLSTGFMLFF